MCLSWAVCLKGKARLRKFRRLRHLCEVCARRSAGFWVQLLPQRGIMNEQIILIVRLRVEENARNLLRENLVELFALIKDENTFLSASLYDDLEDVQQLVVYEVWQETRESFLANQLSKPYRAKYEKLISELRVERTAQWLKPAGSWSSRTRA